MSEVGNIVPVPSFDRKGYTTDKELLASTIGFTQRGVTLAGGQGILSLGTVIGRKTADKLYYVYNSGNGDGTEVPRAVLRSSVDTGTNAGKRFFGQAVYAGILKNNLLSGADANAITVLNARQDTVNNLFSF